MAMSSAATAASTEIVTLRMSAMRRCSSVKLRSSPYAAMTRGRQRPRNRWPGKRRSTIPVRCWANPNAARLFQSYSFTPEVQQLIIDIGGLRSVHPQTKEKPGRKPLSEIKLMKDDAAAVEKTSEEIKARYTKIFRV